MPSRRSHTNSHHGCLQCKSRRVKCDQGQPVCSRCAKKGQDCTYRHLMSSYDPFQRSTTPARPTSSTRTRVVNRSSPSAATAFPAPSNTSSMDSISPLDQNTITIAPFLVLTHLSMPGLDPLTHQLLHHYTTTSGAFLTEPFQTGDVFSTFHAAINRHLFAHSYVHHAVLTYSALHLASVSPSSVAFPTSKSWPSATPHASPHLLAAFSHKASALAHFRPVLGSISSVNCEPALTASGLLVSCAFALPVVSRHHDGSDEYDPVELLAQIISLFHGTVVIFRMGWGHGIRPPLDEVSSTAIRRDVVRAAGNQAAWPEAEESLRAVILAISRLSDQSSHIAMGTSSGAAQPNMGPGMTGQSSIMGRKEVLMDTALKLRGAMRRVAAARGVYHVAIMWFGNVKSAFVERIQERDPLALVLLAHWVICFKDTPHVWWTRGWAEWTVRSIREEIGMGKYGSLMDWPRAEAGLLEENTHRAVSVG